MRERVVTAAAAGMIAALTACTSSAAPSPAAPSPAAPSPTVGSAASVAICTAYTGATGGARQVVATASEKPINGPFAALLMVNLRGITSAASVPADPPLDAAVRQVTAAIDDLAEQLSRALPRGAEPATTSVMVDPSLLGRALDAADAVCVARGVTRKPTTPGATS